jgi:hypothetical protein
MRGRRWELAEENALRAGVKFYGEGKWQAIKDDRRWESALAARCAYMLCAVGHGILLLTPKARSAVDFKDKVRSVISACSSAVPL